MRALRSLVLGTLVCVLVGLSVTAGVAQAAPSLPNSMSAVGDSITRAYNTCSSAFADCPPNSWSAGTSATVNSHYSRVLASNPSISGKSFNDAKSGAKMGDLNGQVSIVNSRGVDYVTILMGGNDVCTSSASTMTSVATFSVQFRTAMTTLTGGSPNTRILVSSVPDVYNLWATLKNNGSARFVWAVFGICQSMLANPLSTAQADVDRRASVRQRNIDFNTELSTVCAAFVNCLFDGNAVFNTKFTSTDVSTRDYFHPSINGQRRLACVTWGAGYWAPPIKETC